MTTDNGPESQTEQIFAEILDDALKEGHKPDVEKACQEHLELASALRECAARYEAVMDAFKVLPGIVGAPYDVDAASQELAGKKVGAFVIGRRLGQGGMGSVYLAIQPSLNRQVVLKILPQGLLAGKGAVQRFRREGEALGRLRHRNIVRVFEAGEDKGVHFLAMEYVEGLPVDRVISMLRENADEERHGQAFARLFGRIASKQTTLKESPWRGTYEETAARIISEVADALDYAHTQGVIHRDIKPSNVILSPDGTPRLLDFGLASLADGARMTMTGELLGTPRYMPPEQIEGPARQVDARSDVYSLGLVLYELLTLQPAFDGDTPAEAMFDVLRHDSPRPSEVVHALPKDLEAIVLKAIEKGPKRRYESAAAMAEDLRRFSRGEPVTVRPLGVTGRLLRKAGRHPSKVAIVALCALVVGLTTYRVIATLRAARQARLTSLIQEAENVLMSGTQKKPQLEKARNLYVAAIQRGASRPSVYSGLGVSLYDLGETDEGQEWLRRAARKSASSGNSTAEQFLLADRLYNCKLYAEATKVYAAAIERAPPSAEGWNDFGDALYMSKDFGDAVTAYEKALELDPNEPVYIYNLAVSLREIGNATEAIDKLRLAIQKNPGDFDFHSDLAIALESVGELAEAEGEHREAVRLRPANPILRARFARLLIRVGKPQQARAQLEQAVTLVENDPKKDWERECGSLVCSNIREELQSLSSQLEANQERRSTEPEE